MKIQTSHGKTISKEEVALLPVEGEAIPATDENLANAEAELPENPGQRPSLEVESSVHANLGKRILAHLARMRAWDLRSLTSGQAEDVRDAIFAVAKGFNLLDDALAMLSGAGFVAKTTPVTRIASKLILGTLVDLREYQRAEFAKVYTEEQLASLSVVKCTDTHVQLMAEDGSNIGLVKIIHVKVK